MEESFELLSSMSPKVKHCQKHFRKGTTVLALRRSLQRSSLCNRSITKNEDLVITEISSSSTSGSSSRSANSNDKRILNESPIIVSDSDTDLDELKLISKKAVRTKHSVKHKDEGNYILSEDKLENIKHWIDNVNHQTNFTNNSIHSVYTELSSVDATEDCTDFVSERTGRAINSTAVQLPSPRFDQLFKRKSNQISLDSKICINDDACDSIEESYVESKTSLNKKLQFDEMLKDDIVLNRHSFIALNETKNRELCQPHLLSDNLNVLNKLNESNTDNASIGKDCDSSFYSLDESLRTRLKNKESGKNVATNNKKTYTPNSAVNSGSGDVSDNNELASMLDDLYGKKWREKEQHVLPKSEPRKRLPNLNNGHISNTERKPKFSALYKNPYLETEKLKSDSLLKALHTSRLKNYMESPVIKRINDYCDSDTDSSKQNCPRRKLDFNNSFTYDEEIIGKNQAITSKYFKDHVESKNAVPKNPYCDKNNESDKENCSEISDLGQSLEERIQRKIDKRIKNICDETDRIRIKLGGKKALSNKKNVTGGCEPNIKASSNIKSQEEKTDTDKLSNDSISSVSSDDAWEKEISKISHERSLINGKYSFLASLSDNVPILQCDMSARIYRANFKLHKDKLLSKLFQLYNEKIFENAIPHDTALEWNDRMRGTAGFCYCKKITKRTGTIERKARIALSTKVIDSAYRLRDTLIHEMCHAATWIVNCVSDGHGPYWKAWAYKAMKIFPELPPIKRCHDYAINYKYTYRCTSCGYSIGRHSKSLNIERKRCGYCYGKFEILLNKVNKKGEAKSVPATPKKEASGFALFVKENYSAHKQPHLKHGDVMKLLGQKFQEMKLKPKPS